MKLASLRALEKHLQESASRAPVYLIACHQEADRREIASRIVPSGLERLAFADAQEELRSGSLFSTGRMIMVDEIDKLKEEESAFLQRWIQNPSGKITLLLGFENGRALAPFLPHLKQEAVLLDLLQEKPWERQQRLADDLRAMARQAKTAIDEEAMDFLFQQVGQDWPLLKREMEKLLTFGGEKKQVGLEEARSLVASGVFPEGWTLAEQLIFNPYGLASTPPLDASALLSLLGQLRYFLRMGRQLVLGDEKLKPYQVQKYGSRAREKGLRFFEKGMIALNEVEALAKSSSISGDILLHRFAVHLHTV